MKILNQLNLNQENVMESIIRKQLIELVDADYRKFTAALLPNTNNILGVRLPALRKIAKQIAQDDWRGYLDNALRLQHWSAASEFFEEIMLQGMVIGYVETDVEERLADVAAFIPKIDNWSVCDSFCSGLKFAKDNQKRVWSFLQPYLASDLEYQIRFGVVMLLNFFVKSDYIDQVLKWLDRVKTEDYYAKMAVAWAVSVCYVKFPEQTMVFLKNNTLTDFTFNKALQKITESIRVSQEAKVLIKKMKPLSLKKPPV